MDDAFFAGGVGESIKYGVLMDAALFDRLADKRLTKDAADLAEIATACVSHKNKIVSEDEFEKGTAFFAIRSGAPVIPIYIHPDSQRRLRPVIMVGKAIDVSEIAANAQKSTLIDVVTDELADAVAALGTELEEIYCN